MSILKAKIYNVLSFLLLWIFFGFNTYNSDYRNYETIYNIIARTGDYYSSNIEIGFKFIMKVFSNLNFNYQEFLICYSFICLLIFFKGISRFTTKPYVVMIIFFFYPFFQYILAIRLMMSLSLLINAVYYLKEKSLKNIIIYCALIIIASLFHQTAFAYILLLMIFMNRKLVKLCSLVTTFCFLIILFIPQVIQLIGRVFPKFLIYMNDGTNPATIFVIIIYYIVIHFILNYSKLEVVSEHKSDSELIRKMYSIMIVFIPLMYFSMDFFRLITNTMVFIYIYFSNLKLIINGYTTQKKCIVWSMFIIFLIVQNFTFGYLNNFESQIIPIITNNMFF
ncbi:EpsG family protein [Thomasclavelia sp.]|uniref:EpsG family protein n=1 Tax=Thomasclavelia sp. TaxID=3025757 RepID=UPI00345DFC13